MPNYNMLQGPTQTGETLDTAQQGGFAKLLADPNFQYLLAGIGTRLDPQGAGGAIGGSTQNYLSQQALQKTAARTQEQQNKRHSELLAAFARTHTPEGVEGRTSTTISGDKIVEKGNRGSTEYTETQPVSIAAPQEPGDYSTAIPAGTPPVTSTPTVPTTLPKNEARNFYPFSRALLG